jgi:hypothetical protein
MINASGSRLRWSTFIRGLAEEVGISALSLSWQYPLCRSDTARQRRRVEEYYVHTMTYTLWTKVSSGIAFRLRFTTEFRLRFEPDRIWLVI